MSINFVEDAFQKEGSISIEKKVCEFSNFWKLKNFLLFAKPQIR